MIYSRKMISVCLALVCLLFLKLPSMAESGSNDAVKRTIKTDGTALILVQPDKFTLVAVVETIDKSLKRACALHDQTTASVLGLAKKYKIESGNVQTTEISVSPINESGCSNHPSVKPVKGYKVSRNVSFIFNDRKMIAPLFSDVIEAGAHTISGIKYGTTMERKYRDEARTKALTAARQKAELLAKVENSHVGKALNIVESNPYSYSNSNNSILPSMLGGDDFIGGIAIGQIPVRGSVSVTYELQ